MKLSPTDIEQNQSEQHFKSRVLLGSFQSPSLALWLKRKGIVKDETTAKTLIYSLIAFDFAATLILLLSIISVDGFAFMYNEATLVYENVQQYGLPSNLAYTRLTVLTAVADIIGLICALWLPILIIAVIVIAVVYFYRTRR